MGADSAPRTADRDTPRPGGAERLAAAIEDSARRLTFGALLRRLLYLVAAVILFPLLVVVGDHAIPGGLPRLLVFGAGILWGLATVFAVMGVSLRTLLRRLNRVFVARHVERSRGIRHNPLVNMVLLERSPEAGYARDGAAQQVGSVLETAGPEAPGSTVSLRQPGVILLMAVGFWLLYMVITPKPILPSLARLFGADRDAPTATQLELLHPRPNEPVYVGEPLEIEFAVSGRSVVQVWFELLNPAAPGAPPLLRNALRRSPDADPVNRYRLALAAHEVSSDLHYRCSAGDAVVEGVIAVQPQPDLREWQIELVPPAYVGQPAQHTTDPELRVWSGTRATFAALGNTDVHDPVFVFRGDTETRTRMSVDPTQLRRAELALRLTKSGEYWLEFSDRWGRSRRDPPVHRIIVREDLAPRVEITTPSKEETPSGIVDLADTAWLRAVAADDVRLDALYLVRDVGGEISRTSLLDSPREVRGRSIEVGVATSDLALKVGDSVPVWFEAHDDRVLLDGTPAPQVTTSRELILVRLPDVLPANVGDAGVVDLTDLADSSGTKKQVVKRPRASDGTGEAAAGDGTDEAGERQEGPGSAGGKYRRAPDGGTDADADDDQEPPGLLDPEDVVEVDGEDDVAPQGAEDDGAAGERSEAANEFNQELRRFGEQHGDEAREVNRRLGSGQPEDTDADDAQSGQGEAGAGEQDDSRKPDSQPGSEADPNFPETEDIRPGGIAERKDRLPESQPAEPGPSESDQPEPPAEPPPAPHDEKPAHEGSEGQRDNAGETTPPEEPAQPETEPAPSKEGGQEPAKPGRQDEKSKPEQPDSDAESKEPDRSEEQAESPDDARPEPEPAQEPGAEQGQGPRDDQPEPSEAADHPAAEPGERVIPMPGRRPAPEIQPPSEPAPSQGPADDEPAESAERSDLSDTLELLERGEEIPEEDLVELGWPAVKRSAFVRDFERLRDAARRAGVLSQLKWWRTRLDLGSGEVTPGAGLSEDVSTGVAGGPAVRDGLEQIAPPPEQQIAPELRALLEAYYRSLAEKRAQQRESEAPSSP